MDHGWLDPFGAPWSFYFVDMEFCDLTLDQYIHSNRWDIEAMPEQIVKDNPVFVPKDSAIPLKLQNVWTIMSHIAAGIDFMHKHNQVHRDLKPRNGNYFIWKSLITSVLYSRRKNLWKIIDFGNTVEATSQNPRTSRYVRGTAGYRAPELILDSHIYTNKADVWALGCILYELAVGKKAFDSDWNVIRYYHENDNSLRISPVTSEGRRS